MDNINSFYPTPEHQFLKSLNACNPQTTDEDIKEIAKKTLNLTFVYNIDKPILSSVKVLMRDAILMSSYEDAKEEIGGAINALNILIKHETNSKKQTQLKEEIKGLGKYQTKIDDIFLLKEVIGLDNSLMEILKDERFLEVFFVFRTLYGRKQTMDPSSLRSFIRLWLSIPASRPYLNRFLEDAYYIRNDNLKLLREGKIPSIQEQHSARLVRSHGAWIQFTGELYSTSGGVVYSDYQSTRLLLDDIYNVRATVTNTQVNTDSLGMAFNCDDPDKLSIRFREIAAAQKRTFEAKLQELQTELSGELDVSEKEKIQGKIESLQKLEKYYPRDAGTLIQTAQWIPQLGPKDPIQPLVRIIGFATKEGIKKETATKLDFTRTLGEANLFLNIGERRLLGQLLCITDTLVCMNPEEGQEKDRFMRFQDNLIEVLEKFTRPDCPHLSTLTERQKQDLVKEAYRFAYEVNLHLADDQLNLY